MKKDVKLMGKQGKNNALILYQVLMKYSDKEHPLSMSDIKDYMAEETAECGRDSIARYLNQLEEEMGIDIHRGKGQSARYYIDRRLLDKEELKLITDAVYASNFIEKGIADNMIKKLKTLRSIYDGEELDRSIQCVNVAKAENDRILENVRIIQEAIKKNKQIIFDYMKWNNHKQLVRKNIEGKYSINPWTLIWANDRYYLYGYDTFEKDGVRKERHYRVDKLDNIEIMETDRQGKELFMHFNADTYVAKRMGMYTDKERRIKVRIPESLVGTFIDQFGKWIDIKEEAICQQNIESADNEHNEKAEEKKLLVTFCAVKSNVLLGWLIGLGSVEVLEPEDVKEKMIGVSYRENPDISLDELRYVRIIHYDFKGQIQEGELVVNQKIAYPVMRAFYQLYKWEYPIERVRLVDDFDGDDEASMEANNTSAFNYRTVEGRDELSKHALGMAIDINPLMNPYVREDGYFPKNATEYLERDITLCKGEHKDKVIHKKDMAYKIFKRNGFLWGGDWEDCKDYQHFYMK